MRLVVSKLGGVYRSRDAGSNFKGEQGETEGLLRHLVTEGHSVTYYGRLGEDSELPEGICHVDPTLVDSNGDPFSDMTLAREQERAYTDDARRLAEHVGEQPVWVQVAGYSSSMSIIDNPKGASVQACAVRYVAPAIGAGHVLGARRVIVNNDPRTYPREQEMTLMWPDVMPVALLDQCEGEVSTVIGGTRCTRRSAYAACESWGYLERVPNTGEHDCVIVAHAHIADGCRQQGRDLAWARCLEGVETLGDVRVYGKGWEHFSGYDPDRFPGPIPGDRVIPLLATAKCSPCVAAKPGFYTGKPYVLNAAGCVPLMWGDGYDQYTWDPQERLVRLDSPCRVRGAGDLPRAVNHVRSNLSEYREMFDRLLTPKWGVLDECLWELEHGAGRDDLWDRFGGWRRA